MKIIYIALIVLLLILITALIIYNLPRKHSMSHYENALDSVYSVLDSHHIEPFLMFGTLLGFIREGGVISYDKDIDLAIHEKHEKALIEILQSLPSNISIVKRFDDEVTCRINSVNVDIFILREYNGDLFSTSMNGICEKSKFHKCRYRFDYDSIFPLEIVEFGNRILRVPAKPESVLEQRYGPDWMIPKKFGYYDGLNNCHYKGLITSDFPKDTLPSCYYDETYTHAAETEKPFLWIYWQNATPTSVKPPYLDLCLETILTQCSTQYSIQVVDDNRLDEISKLIHPNFRNITPLAMRSDYVRFSLLYEFGGVYIDSDFIALTDLRPLRLALQQYKFIAFTYEPYKFHLSLIAGQKGNDVCKFAKHLMEKDKWIHRPVKINWAKYTNSIQDYAKSKQDEVLYLSNKYVAPIHYKKSLKYFWSDDTLDMNKIQKLWGILLNNEMYGENEKTMDAQTVLNGNMRISELLRIGLE